MADAIVVRQTALDKVLLITPPTVYEDFRGGYVELYNEDLYRSAGIEAHFVQDDASTSRRHVLRGIHGDGVTTKLISCLYGSFYLVVVDCDQASPKFGRWFSVTLSASRPQQVLVPPKHGLAHLVMSEAAIFHYKQTTYYERDTQFTYRWDEPRFGIYWPIRDPILSPRDAMIEN